MCTGEGARGDVLFNAGGNGPPVQGSALGKEGRKYGVGMGKNCPFMRETTALKPTMDGVGMGENCPFMRGKRLLSPTNYWAEMPDTCAVGVSARIWGCAGGKRLFYARKKVIISH